MAELATPSGHVVLVDERDVPVSSVTVGSHGYAQIFVGGRMELLHRHIVGCTKGDGKVIDHKNRNRLDCRRANLRVTDYSGNAEGSRHRGGAYPSPHGKWYARGKKHGVVVHLGTFDTEAEARAAALAWRTENHTLAQQDGT